MSVVLRQILVVFLALGFVGAIIAAHLLTSDQAPRLVERIINSLHAPGFAAVAIIIFGFIRRSRTGVSDYIKAGLIAGAIGILAEASQIPGPRDADLVDFIEDIIGIAAGLGIVALSDKQLRGRLRVAGKSFLIAVTSVAILLTIGPVLWFSYAYLQQNLAAPSLMTFDKQWEVATIGRRFYEHSKVDKAPIDWPVSDGDIAYAKVDRYGSSIISIFPYADWSAYATLSFTGSIDGDQHAFVRLYVRDNPIGRRDPSHEYVERLEFSPTPRRYKISLSSLRRTSSGHSLDIGNIWSMGLIADKTNTDVTYLLDDFRLEY